MLTEFMCSLELDAELPSTLAKKNPIHNQHSIFHTVYKFFAYTYFLYDVLQHIFLVLIHTCIEQFESH